MALNSQKFSRFLFVGLLLFFAICVLFIGWQEFKIMQYENAAYPNRDRECVSPADPVRIDIGSVLFNIPRSHISRLPQACYMYAPWLKDIFPRYARKCTHVQHIKEFKNPENGGKIAGFCQENDDKPFVGANEKLIGPVVLGFSSQENQKSLSIKLSAPNKSDLDFNLKSVEFVNESRFYGVIRKYGWETFCEELAHEFDSITPNPDFMGFQPIGRKNSKHYWSGRSTKNASFLGNPVLVSCNPPDSQSGVRNCSLLSKINHDLMISTKFNDNELPNEYWTSFVNEIEKIIGPMIDLSSKNQIGNICPGAI